MASSFGLLFDWEFPRTDPLAGSPVYVSLGGIVDGNAPEITKETFPDRTLNQDDRYTAKIAGFLDGGKPTVRVKFDKDDYDDLLTAVEDEGEYRFKITVRDNATLVDRSYFTFAAQVTKLGTPFSADGDRVICDVELDVSGAVTFTPGN